MSDVAVLGEADAASVAAEEVASGTGPARPSGRAGRRRRPRRRRATAPATAGPAATPAASSRTAAPHGAGLEARRLGRRSPVSASKRCTVGRRPSGRTGARSSPSVGRRSPAAPASRRPRWPPSSSQITQPLVAEGLDERDLGRHTRAVARTVVGDDRTRRTSSGAHARRWWSPASTAPGGEAGSWAGVPMKRATKMLAGRS